MARQSRALLAGLLLVAAACNQASQTPTPGPTASATPTAPVPSTSPGPSATAPVASHTNVPPATQSPATAGPPEHRIGVRDTATGRELYDVSTGEPFRARGVNLLRLVHFGAPVYDTLWGSGYDAAWVDATLDRLAGLGYNTVRVFLDLCKDDCIAPTAGGGLRPTYLNHVADFLGRAKSRGIFVLAASNDLPDSPDYGNAVPCCSPFSGYRNSVYLSAEGHAAAERYWRDIVGGLIERGAATDAVLAWQLANEQFTFLDQPPLSLRTGSLTTGDGRTWDLSSDEQRREMVESNVVAFADRLRTAIRALDPTALVTMGFFAPNEPIEWRPNDSRFVLTRAVLERSTLDFADLHAYPGGSFDVADHLVQYAVSDAVRMPLVMGEMGAFKFWYSTPAEGANGLVQWQVEACQHFQGWLLWLDGESDNDEVWTGSEGDGAINRALSPAARPDPCDPGEFNRRNLAVGAGVRVSAELPDSPAGFAVDGVPGTNWIAGADAPQWIEIDLGAMYDITSVELVVAQSPAGLTRHKVLVGGTRGGLRQVDVLRGETTDGDVLIVELAAADGRGVRFVRIDTTHSPSWVAWREIRVFGQ